jgi:glucoamylase
MDAPGYPGIPPTWSSSAKDLVTTALGPSRLWATLGYGILNEVYWPSTGEPQIRDLGFIVAGESGWFEVKRVNRYTLTTPQPYVLLPTVTHEGERYRLTLEVLPDPLRDVLLIRYQLEGEGLKLYPLLAPHLGPKSAENTAWTVPDPFGGLFAQGGSSCLCLIADAGFVRSSAGFVGVSDGWSDFAQHGQMTWRYTRAAAGNVALLGELGGNRGVLALGFASTPEGSRTLARSSLAEGFGAIRARFVGGWEAWGAGLELSAPTPALAREAQLSAAVLKAHEDRTYPGAVVASLSVPWGNARDDLGGYHLVWARDAVEAGFGLLAAGQTEDARRLLGYLVATQRPDGCWSQNFFPDGRPYWQGVQLDEVGFPVLLAAKLGELGAFGTGQGVPEAVQKTVRRALSFLAQRGPLSPQDRWEENAGVSPFTLAVVIAALVAGANFLEGDAQRYALSLADCWNARLESWTYVSGTPLAREHGLAGYYVRLAPSVDDTGPDVGLRGRLEVKNRGGATVAVSALVSLDFLYLARLGLRAPDDPRMLDTVKLVDALLRVETPSGAGYYRYNEDGYGEHPDGGPFDGSGVGRLWPLLTGERGHFALECGEDPTPYLEAMVAMTGPGGLIPEQVWDTDPLPERGLCPGKPSGSAMPLLWAHAELIKLLAAQRGGGPFERPRAVWERYRGRVPEAATWHWRDAAPFTHLPAGRDLLIEASEPFGLHVGVDGWQGVRDLASTPLGLGMHGVRLTAAGLQDHTEVNFTRFDPTAERWEGRDHTVYLMPAEP